MYLDSDSLYAAISPSFKKYEYFWNQYKRFPSSWPSVISLEKNKSDKIPHTVLKLAVGSPTNLVYLVTETLLCTKAWENFESENTMS